MRETRRSVSTSFIDSATQTRRIPLRMTQRSASRMTSMGARSQAMKRMPGVMKPSGVSGIRSRTARMRSHGSSACARTAISMCVLLVKSIAWKPTRSVTGAISAIIAVVSASALQRLWCPSRTVVSTSPIMPAGCGRARRRTATGSPFARQTSATTPLAPATTALISFMTSRMQTCVPSSTWLPTSTNGASPGPGAR